MPRARRTCCLAAESWALGVDGVVHRHDFEHFLLLGGFQSTTVLISFVHCIAFEIPQGDCQTPQHGFVLLIALLLRYPHTGNKMKLVFTKTRSFLSSTSLS